MIVSHTLNDKDALFDLIEKYRLGVLTTAIESDRFPFLQSTHIPFVLDRDGGKEGILRGHIARANPKFVAMSGIAPTLSRMIAAMYRPSFDASY